MQQRKLRVVVMFSGRGKSSWFADIAAGSVPNSILHTFAQLENPHLQISYMDADPVTVRSLLNIFRADAVIASDTTPAFCAAGVLHAITGGLLGARTFLICVNTSSIMRKTKGLRLKLLKLCWRKCTGIICLARFQMEDMKHIGVRSDRLTVIPLGIDATFMQKESSTGEEYILSVGHDAGRDYEYLLQMAPFIPRPIRIVAKEQNIPRGTSLPANVSVEYSIPITQVRERMSQARMVVVPTKQSIEEGSDCSGQTVVLQALAAGTPVLASVRPWIEEYLKQGVEYIGLVDGDAEAAAKSVNELWENAEKRKALAQAGEKAVEEKYTTDIFAASLSRFIIRRTAKGNQYPTEK